MRGGVNHGAWLPWVYLNVALLCQVVSMGFGKQAALSMGAFTLSGLLANVWYFLSLGALVVQALVWPLALRHYPLSFAYFYMSLSYIGVLLLSWLIFAETVTPQNLMGGLLVLIGVNLMTGDRAVSRDD